MSEDAVEIQLNGRNMRIACPPDQRESLLQAATLLDSKLRELAAASGATGERLATMAALHVAHEFISFQRSGGFDMPDLRRRIEVVNAQLGEALKAQEKLF
ncbi:MAG TPA: cell division protein ZapA [Azoarcus sp.]|nr:cell division protein ZapA [Azoarcus sp.]